MRAYQYHHLLTNFILQFVFCCLVHSTFGGVVRIQDSAGGSESHRRILHQPLYPPSTAPPPVVVSPPSPPESSDQPFFPEVPTYPGSNQTPPPPPAVQSNGSVPIPTATQAQPAKPTKKVVIAISVGIVTLGMLSALAFFLFRHRARHPHEAQKLVGGGDSSRRVPNESRAPPSTFLYIGTVEPANRRSVPDTNVENGANGSPYHKLNSIKRSDRYRPSPELQPLPPLAKALSRNSVSAMSSSDEESLGTSFHTPYGSMGSTEDGYYTPVSRRSNPVNGHSSLKPGRGENNHKSNSSVPHSKRTSPRGRLSSSPPEDTKLTMLPSIKQFSPSTLPPAESRINRVGTNQLAVQVPHQRPKFEAPPPPPNRGLLQAISRKSPQRTNVPAPPPPPPPPPLPLFTPRKLVPSDSRSSSTPSQVSTMELSSSSTPKTSSTMESSKPSDEVNRSGNSLERHDSDERTKLKPLHWDKVRATSDRATVWDQLKSSSFQLNEDMMETLFGCNSANSVQKEATRKSVLPPVERENRVLDPKKSQNIAILLRALNVTNDEVLDALLEGNPESLGAELLETLVKMAPTKEEEIKLRDYNGDTSKLGSAERFLKTVLDIPFAFKRVEAMLYRANFDAEVKYLKKSFHTLEEASEELRSSRLFLKLLEAVLRTGNRMNVGTNRGDARAFKLDTLLKLVDIKGTDGKTTLLHFVVQEIIRSEDADTESNNENLQNKMNSKLKDGEFNKRGLQVVAGLSKDLGSVKKAAGMDSDVLSGYVSKLESGLNKVKLVLQHERPNLQGRFFNSMKLFLKQADEEIVRTKSDERKALSMVKEVTEYFHGDTAKEEAHPLRIFLIVRDFLFVLDHVCKEVGNMQDRAIVGAARSFRISSCASLPVLNRFNVRQESSDDESLSP